MVSSKHELLPPFHREQKGTAGGNSPELNLLFSFSVPFLKKIIVDLQYCICFGCATQWFSIFIHYTSFTESNLFVSRLFHFSSYSC